MYEADAELIELVEHSAEGTGTYQVVATFRTYRKRRDGNHQLVYVELLDSGTPGDYRWLVEAKGEAGDRASGNGGPTPQMALATTHWAALDGDD